MQFSYRKLLFAIGLIATVLVVTPCSVSAQSAGDTIAIFRTLSKSWKDRAPGKPLAILTVFVGRSGETPQLPDQAEIHRQKNKIHEGTGAEFVTVDALPANADHDANVRWMRRIRDFSAQYAIGPMDVGPNSATVEVYESVPFDDLLMPVHEHIDLIRHRYQLARTNGKWVIISDQLVSAARVVAPQ